MWEMHRHKRTFSHVFIHASLIYRSLYSSPAMTISDLMASASNGRNDNINIDTFLRCEWGEGAERRVPVMTHR